VKIKSITTINCPMCHHTEARVEFEDDTAVYYSPDLVRALAVGDIVDFDEDGVLRYVGRDD